MGVGVEVDTEQEAAEGSSKAIGKVFIFHAPVKREWDGVVEWEMGLVATQCCIVS